MVPPGSSASDVASIVAGITLYRPDASLLRALLCVLAEEAVPVLIYVDGPVGEAIGKDLREELLARPATRLIEAPVNRGIGKALNRLVDAAREQGAGRILFFDQDSSPQPGFVAALAERMEALLAAGIRVAAIGPLPIAPIAADTQPPRYRSKPAILGALHPVDYLITSGSLVDLGAIAAVGAFREDFWMDGIDTEWSFRAIHLGFTLAVARDVVMPHRVGTGTVRLGPLVFPQQSQARMASYVRNQLYALRLPHVPLAFKLRALTYVPVQALAYVLSATSRRQTARLLLAAAKNGLTGRLGR